MSSIRTLRWVALTEATSFVALLVATYVKYAHDAPLGVDILGPIHGLLFLAYLWIGVRLKEAARWSNRTLGVVLLGAVIPFGGFVVDRWLSRSAQPRPAA